MSELLTPSQPEGNNNLSQEDVDRRFEEIMDAEGFENAIESPVDGYDIGQEVAVRPIAYTAEGKVDTTKPVELETGWSIRGTAPDGSYIITKEDGRTPDGKINYRTLIADAETLDSWQEDYAFDENARRDESRTQSESSPSDHDVTSQESTLDSLERVEPYSPDIPNYSTRVANLADRLATWLDEKAEKYEKTGGVKGYLNKVVRRIGSVAYRKSGLKAGVEKARDVSDKIESTVAISADKVRQTREELKARRAAAYERSLQRAIAREKQKQERKAQRKRQRQERREQKVMEYVESQKLSGKHARDRKNKEQVSVKDLQKKALYEYNYRGGSRPDFLDQEKPSKLKAARKNLGRVGFQSPLYMKERS